MHCFILYYPLILYRQSMFLKLYVRPHFCPHGSPTTLLTWNFYSPVLAVCPCRYESQRLGFAHCSSPLPQYWKQSIATLYCVSLRNSYSPLDTSYMHYQLYWEDFPNSMCRLLNPRVMLMRQAPGRQLAGVVLSIYLSLAFKSVLPDFSSLMFSNSFGSSFFLVFLKWRYYLLYRVLVNSISHNNQNKMN